MLDQSNGWIRMAQNSTHSLVTPRRFVALFGVPSKVCPLVWRRIGRSFRIENLKPVHLLWLLYWFKVYPTDDVCSDRWGVCQDTFRKYRDHALTVLDANLNSVRFVFQILITFAHCLLTVVTRFILKIKWENRFKDFVPVAGIFQDHTFSIDVTECEVARPNDKDMERLFWSGKAKKPTVKYEGTSVWFRNIALNPHFAP